MPNPTRSRIRELIKAEELVKLLQDNVLDEKADPLHQSKLHAIKILLAKAVPDIKAVEHSGQIDSEITKRHRVTFRK